MLILRKVELLFLIFMVDDEINESSHSENIAEDKCAE